MQLSKIRNIKSKKVVAACLIAALGVSTAYSVMASPLDDIAWIQLQQEEVYAELEQIKGAINELEQRKSAVLSQIDSYDAQLVTTIATINSLETSIKNKEEEMEETAAQLEKAEAEEAKQYEAMKSRIQYMYEQGGDLGLASVLLETDGLGSVLNRAEDTQDMYEYDRAELEEYTKTTEKIEKLQADQRKQKSTLLEMKRTQTEVQKRLEDLKSQAQAASENYEAQLTQASQQAVVYQQLIEQQNAEIARLQEVQRQIEEAARIAAEQEAARQAAAAWAAQQAAYEAQMAAQAQAEAQQAAAYEEQQAYTDAGYVDESAYDAGTGVYDAGTGVYDAGTGVYDAGTGVYDAGTGAYDAGTGVYDDGTGAYDAGTGVYDDGAGTYYTDTAYTDASASDTASADTGYTDAGYVDTGYTDTGYVDTGYVDTGYVDTGYVDTGYVDTGYVDTGYTDTTAADTSTDYTYTPSSDGTVTGQDIANYALQFVGNPYVWGGTDLVNGADCSGFVQSVYGDNGISLSRTTYTQADEGIPVSYDEMQPGDVINYGFHTAIYLGDNQIVHAADESLGIIVSDNPAFEPIVTIRRFV